MVEGNRFVHLTAFSCMQSLKVWRSPLVSLAFTRWAALPWTSSTALMWAYRTRQDLVEGRFGPMAITCITLVCAVQAITPCCVFFTVTMIPPFLPWVLFQPGCICSKQEDTCTVDSPQTPRTLKRCWLCVASCGSIATQSLCRMCC